MQLDSIQRILKRLDRNLSGPISMFPDQFLYGAREIINAYTGFDSKTIFKATFEHGWDLNSSKPISKITGGKYPHFSWCIERIQRSGFQNSYMVPIGSPFVYLIKMIEGSINTAVKNKVANSKNILFFPMHGNEFKYQNTSSQIDLFKKHYDPGKTTVCLYWAEFVDPKTTKQYLDAGFSEIITAGFSGQMETTGLGYSSRQLASSQVGGRNFFYLNLISYLIKHQKIVIGGFASICFYAAYLEKEIHLLEGSSSEKVIALSNKYKYSIDTYNTKEREFLSDLMQMPFSKIDLSSTKFRDFAKLELGVQHIKSPAVLREILDSCRMEFGDGLTGEITKKAIKNYSTDFLGVD
jgi:hypothetical protein